MHIFRRRSAQEAELRRADSLDAGLAALPASSRPVEVATRNQLRAVAVEIVDGAERARAEALELDATGASALGLIHRDPDLSVGDLAAQLDRSHSATVRVVDRLQEAGLVQRKRSRRDARRAVLSVTPAGRRALDASVAPADQAVDALLSDLTSGERVLLKKILAKMVGQIMGGVPQGGRVCRYCDPGGCGAESCPRERLI